MGVTAALAAVTFALVIGAGIAKFGPVRFWLGQVPHMDVPLALKVFLWPMMFVMEIVGLLVKHSILAVRLFANMFAGHLVLAVIVGFIAAAAPTLAWYGVAPTSVFGRGGAESVGIHGGFLAGLCLHVFGGLVHRHGGSSALT